MEHIEEKLLELYALKSSRVSERADEIRAHLAVCAGCAALVKEFEEYYSSVDLSGAVEIGRHPFALARPAPVSLDRPSARSARLAAEDRRFPVRAARFIVRHPFVSSSAFLIAAALAVLATLSPRGGPTDTNP